MSAKAVRRKPALKLEGSLDSIIHVDRSIPPIYPKWVKRVMRPDLERSGPARYDLAHVTLWLHEEQKRGGVIRGHSIHRYLVNTNSLPTCLGLRDAEEIQKNGIAAFRRFFGATVFFWRSVVQRDDGYLSVPYLYEYYSDELVLNFLWLGDDWISLNPAARFWK